MKEFDYVIIGGGCAGLSLAYELEIHEKLKDKTLAIIEPRDEYKKDKTWSFWGVTSHNFDDCVKKSGKIFQLISQIKPTIYNVKILRIKVLTVVCSIKKLITY
jgi:flavin-dependent dehydrogenase